MVVSVLGVNVVTNYSEDFVVVGVFWVNVVTNYSEDFVVVGVFLGKCCYQLQ